MREPTTPGCDLYVSYAQEDEAWVRGYLQDALYGPDECHLAGAYDAQGTSVRDVEIALQQSTHALIVLTHAYLAGDWEPIADLITRWYRSAEGRPSPIVLLLERVKIPVPLLAFDLWDGTARDDWPALMGQLCGLLQRPLLPDLAKERGDVTVLRREPQTFPWQGMAPYSGDRDETFVGRDTEIRYAVEQLHRHPFLTILGPPGSGKSSLVSAGVIPALQGSSDDDKPSPVSGGALPALQGPPGSGKSSLVSTGAISARQESRPSRSVRWCTCKMRPGEHPLYALRAALEVPRTALGNLEHTVHQVLGRCQAEHLLLVVDSFEDLFASDIPEGGFFQELLLQLSHVSGCFVIVLLQSDYAELPYTGSMIEAMWDEIEGHRLDLSPMTERELERVIAEPAERKGVFLEPALIRRLVQEAHTLPKVLPLLQETLRRLWKDKTRRYISNRDYDRLIDQGEGLSNAVAARADGLFEALSPKGQMVAQRIFMRLVQFDVPESPDQETRSGLPIGMERSTAEPSRAYFFRQRPLVDLRSDGENRKRFGEIVRYLQDHHLIEKDLDMVSVASSLVAHWAQLGEWVLGYREDIESWQYWEDGARRWADWDRGEDSLLSEAQIVHFQEWRDSDGGRLLGHTDRVSRLFHASQDRLEGEIFKAARARDEAERARTRAGKNAQIAVRVAAGAAALFLLAVALLGVGVRLFRDANRARRFAEGERLKKEEQAALATSRRLAMESLARKDTDLERALQLSIAANLIQDTFESRDSLLRALQVRVSPGMSTSVTSNVPGPLVALGPDGATLASGGDDTIRLWRVSEQGTLTSLPDVQDDSASDLMALTFLDARAEGVWLVAGHEDGTVYEWDVTDPLSVTGPVTYSLSAPAGANFCIAFSPDGCLLAWNVTETQIALQGYPSCHGDEPDEGKRAFVIWSRPTRTAPERATREDRRALSSRWYLTSEVTYAVTSMVFAPDGKKLAVGHQDGRIELWDWEREQKTCHLLTPPQGEGPRQSTVWSLAFGDHPQSTGCLLASGHEDNRVILWDLVRRRPLVVLNEPDNPVVAVALSPDGQHMVSVTSADVHIDPDSEAILWDTSNPANPLQLGEPLWSYEGPLSSAVYSAHPDVRTLALSAKNNVLSLWNVDLESWKEIACQRVRCTMTRDQWNQFIGAQTDYRSICRGLPRCSDEEDLAP